MDEESLISSQRFACLQQQLEAAGWEKTAEDGGQSHFVGWEHQQRYEKDGAMLTLIHGERYGKPYYTYKANPKALVQISTLLSACPD